jgi:RHH-type proline utilization regulon transcriptional repressor/proline dehydrogenase/delta 1-pyrroline-5-carboxylate dehydrogenase
MRARKFPIHAPDLPDGLNGFFVAPTIIEIPDVSVLGPEIFGPVLHMLRYPRKNLDAILAQVNALGYGLTFGIHSRIEETISHLTRHMRAGNIYVNRNIIGAVVGVQPFGGHGLSGTGPKAGGPLYLRRLLAKRPAEHGLLVAPPGHAFDRFLQHLETNGIEARHLAPYAALAPARTDRRLTGPVGETNVYRLIPRGKILCLAESQHAALAQVAAVLASGNIALIRGKPPPALTSLPPELAAHIMMAEDGDDVEAALFEGDAQAVRALLAQLAARPGKIVPVYTTPRDGGLYPTEFLMAEVVVSTNTAAAGGNASLMTIG